MTFGERIRIRRKELGYSADKLAQLINKNRATIYRYELGEIKKIPVSAIEPIAVALKTTPAHLLGWEYEVESKNNDIEINTIATHVDGDPLTDEEQEEVLDFVKYVISKRKKLFKEKHELNDN